MKDSRGDFSASWAIVESRRRNFKEARAVSLRTVEGRNRCSVERGTIGGDARPQTGAGRPVPYPRPGYAHAVKTRASGTRYPEQEGLRALEPRKTGERGMYVCVRK